MKHVFGPKPVSFQTIFTTHTSDPARLSQVYRNHRATLTSWTLAGLDPQLAGTHHSNRPFMPRTGKRSNEHMAL